jgi:hypothetical protein
MDVMSEAELSDPETGEELFDIKQQHCRVQRLSYPL